MISEEVLEEIQNLDIEFIAEEIGIEVKQHRANCPFHEDDRRSLVFYPLKGQWRCPICHSKGNVEDLVARRYTLTTNNAQLWIANFMGLCNVPGWTLNIIDRSIKVVEKDKEYAKKKADLEAVRKRIEAQRRKEEEEKKRKLEEARKQEEEQKRLEELRKQEEERRNETTINPISTPIRILTPEKYAIQKLDVKILEYVISKAGLSIAAKKYLKNQLYFDDELLSKFKIGSITRIDLLYERISNAFGEDRAMKSGLFLYTHQGITAGFPCPCIFIPYYSAGGQLGNIKFISIANKQKSSFIDYTADLPYNLEILHKKPKTLYVANSVIDCIAMIADGKMAITLPQGFERYNNVLIKLKEIPLVIFEPSQQIQRKEQYAFLRDKQINYREVWVPGADSYAERRVNRIEYYDNAE